MTQHVLILGAGFGGLELSSQLSERLADEVDVTLMDRNDAFVFGFSKLDILFRHQSRDEVRLPYRILAAPGVEFRQETVVSIEPQRRRVVTDAATYEPDFLVVALGADYDTAATPGLSGAESSSIRSPVPSACATNSRPSTAGACSSPRFPSPSSATRTLGGVLLRHDYLVGRGLRSAADIHVSARSRLRFPSRPRCRRPSSRRWPTAVSSTPSTAGSTEETR